MWSGFHAVKRLLVCVVVSALVSCSDGSDQQHTSTPWPGGVWEPATPTFDMTVVKDIPVTMDDGVILHANVGYPATKGSDERASGTFPVLLTQNPYGSGSGADAFFVSRGYIHVVTEVRGTGESQLSLAEPDGPLPTDNRGRREALDGAALVAWASNLDGSNGRMGLYGCSWLGINQILTAGELDSLSPVKAMIPACAGQDYSTYFVGGVGTAVVNFFDLQSSILGTKHIPENLAAGALLKQDALAGGDSSLNREYWQERASYLRVNKMVANDIPTLLWTGWNALEGVTGGVDLYSALQNAASGKPTYGPMKVGARTPSGNYQIIVGPGSHGEGLDKSIQLLWYDHWIKGQKTNVDMTTTGMHMYELGADRWINHASWPITDDYTAVYLTDNGLDTTSLTHSAMVTFGDSSEPGTTLSYDSQPLDTDKTVAGPIAATLYIRSSNANAHFTLTLYDVAPDSSISELTRGNLIASLRDLNPDRSWYDANGLAIKPEGRYFENIALIPNELYRLDIELLPTLRRLVKGHSLRLVVGTGVGGKSCSQPDIKLLTAWPRPCVFTALQMPTLEGGEYEIVSDANHPSSLNLPLVDPASLTTARSGLTETSPEQTQPLEW